MYFEQQNVIFIHVPKTGGNYFSRAFLRYSSDRIVTVKHQDGINRFHVEGEITIDKHQALDRYAKALGSRMSTCRVYSVVRSPVERLVSLYFSPHRWMQKLPDGSYAPVPVERILFDQSAFETLVNRCRSSWNLLDARSCLKVPALGRVGRHATGAEIHLLDFRNLRSELERFAREVGFDAPEFPPDPVNVSTRPDLLHGLTGPDSPAAQAVLASRHAKDLAFFRTKK